MAYDEALAGRVRDVLDGQAGLAEKRMFGGLAWLVHGNLAVVARHDGDLMVRVGPDDHAALLAEPGAATALMGERAMRGWITVDPAACAGTAALTAWVRRGLAYALGLPPK